MNKIENIEEQFNEVLGQKIETQKNKVNYNVKNYLNTKLGQGEIKKSIRIRVINIEKDSTKLYDVLQMHFLPSNMKTYVCSEKTKNLPEKTDRRCPFCAIREQVSVEQRKATPEKFEKLKEIYKQNGVTENYVMRVIERGDEDFGPKFWKFTKKSLESIMELYELNKQDNIDIFDFHNGKDIIITVKKETDQRGKSKNVISSIQASNKQTPLYDSDEIADKWLSDEKVWNDVYVAKPFEYLSLIINGKKPFFDKTKNEWVEYVDRNLSKQDDDDDEVDDSNVETETDDLPF